MGRKLKEHRLPISAMITVPNYYFLRVVQVNNNCTLTEALNIILSEAGAKYALDSYDDEEEQPEPELSENLVGTSQEPLQEEPKEAEPEKEAEPKEAEHIEIAPKKIKPKPVDKGKVGALYKAGWTVAKIADEMRCSQGTVYRIIKEMGL